MDDPGSAPERAPEPHPLRGVGPSAAAVCATFAVVGALLVMFGKPAVDLHPGARRSTPPSPPGQQASGSPNPSATTPPGAGGSPGATPPGGTAAPGAPGAPAGSSPGSSQPAGKGRVVVFNQTAHQGLGAQFAQQLRAEGWTVTGVDTWRGRVPATTVYFPPGMEDVALRLMTEHPEIGRIKPAFAGISRTDLTVIIAGDFPTGPNSAPTSGPTSGPVSIPPKVVAVPRV